MRTRPAHILALSCALLAALGRHAGAVDEPKTRRAETRPVSPAILPKGTYCEVRLLPETKAAAGGKTDTIVTRYEGTVAAASDDRLTLLVSEKFEARRREGPGSRTPVLGRLFTNNGIRRDIPPADARKTVTIPAEKIQTITLTIHTDPSR